MKNLSGVNENKLTGWVSVRGGNFASTADPSVSCTTFNILAPIYKRLDKDNQSCRESDNRTYWLSRNQDILDRLLYERSSVICLQEFWVGNEELVGMYENRLGDAGYITFKLARTKNRGDDDLKGENREFGAILDAWRPDSSIGLFGCTCIKVAHRQYVGRVDVFVSLIGDLNTRGFTRYCSILNPTKKRISSLPCRFYSGDWNGSKRGRVYKFLRSRGFVSSYDTAHQYSDSDADAHKWVSHRNHRGNICGVDFIWLRNPNKFRKPLKTSWREAAFGIIKYRLLEASLAENDAFAFLKGDSRGDYIIYSGFCQALHQLGLSGHPHGLSCEEVADLWIYADIDGHGAVDYGEFQKRIWDPLRFKLPVETSHEEAGDARKDMGILTVGFDVKNAVLFPPEVEKGKWPENYSLSDHAPLTAVFSPRRLSCPRPIC